MIKLNKSKDAIAQLATDQSEACTSENSQLNTETGIKLMKVNCVQFYM